MLSQGADPFPAAFAEAAGSGVEAMMGTYTLLDLTALGRHEDGLSYPMAWVRHHDRYGKTSAA